MNDNELFLNSEAGEESRFRERSEQVLIDSNILVFAYNKDGKEKHEISKKLLQDCWRGRRRFVVSCQNLSEFFVVTTEKIENPLPAEKAETIIKSIIAFPYWKVVSFNEDTVLKAITLAKKYKVHYWDCLIAATMKEDGIKKIYTENKRDFDKLPEIKAINPFEK